MKLDRRLGWVISAVLALFAVTLAWPALSGWLAGGRDLLPTNPTELSGMPTSQNVQLQIGEPSAKFLARFTGQVQVNSQPAGIDFLSLDWRGPARGRVTLNQPHAVISIDHVIGVQTFRRAADERGTKLQRAGKVNPFYPFPTPNNRRGSISADLVINEYRKQRTDKNNIFAIVEIKFEGDKINRTQFEQYGALLKEAAKAKTKGNPVRLNNEAVSSGGRLSLFRYPEDKALAESADEKAQRKPPRKSKTR